jgi:mono/diheme cytochrome c family protein
MTLRNTGLILFLAATATVRLSAESAKERRAHGATVFAEAGCQHCHTIQNVGGKKGPDLSGVGRRLDEAQLRKQILDGGKQMPSFGDILKESETDDLVSYLQSCRKKKDK